MNRIKYNSLSIEQKRNICTYHEKNKGIQNQLIIFFTKEFNLDQPKVKSNQLEDIIMNFVNINMRQKSIDSYLINLHATKPKIY